VGSEESLLAAVGESRADDPDEIPFLLGVDDDHETRTPRREAYANGGYRLRPAVPD